MLTIATVQLSCWYNRDHELDTDFPSAAIEHKTFFATQMYFGMFSLLNCNRSIGCRIQDLSLYSTKCIVILYRNTRNLECQLLL